MKLRILSYGLSATHDRITAIAHFEDPLTVSDYDGFVYDPPFFGQTTRPEFLRRQNEIRDLISLKAGVIICILRPDHQVRLVDVSGATLSAYSLLDSAAPQALGLVRSSVRPGEGSQWRLIPNSKTALNGYFRVLGESLRFEAFLQTDESAVRAASGTVFAMNSVGQPVALEFIAGAGRLCFVPAPRNVPGERFGAAIMQLAEMHYGGPAEIEAPGWANKIAIPGADANDSRIAELEQKRGGIESEISELKLMRSDLLHHRQLLYGYGKTVLEPVVRRAFRHLGFAVLEPAEYQGKWDVDLTEPGCERTAIGEIEGSEGVITVDKYRQLLDYFQTEVLEGRVRKGILIGNGYRLKEPDAPERQSQFTEQVLRGAKQNSFCLLPTTELFKALCAILESPENQALKIEIRNSLLSATGVWTFARESIARAASETSSV